LERGWKLGAVKKWFVNFRTTGQGRWATFAQNNAKDNRYDYHGDAASPMMKLYLTDNSGSLPSSQKNFIFKKKVTPKYEVSKPVFREQLKPYNPPPKPKFHEIFNK
jgi:hypothetical protein